MRNRTDPRIQTTRRHWTPRLIAAACTLCTVAALHAQPASGDTNAPPLTDVETELDHRLGAGVVVGEPTGVSVKYFFSELLAVDGAVGWTFDDDADLAAHGDVLFHRHGLVSSSAGDLAGYLGVGGRFQLRDNAEDRYGVRVPVGVSFMLKNAPVDVFGELAPVIDIEPSVRGDLTAGVGVRYWF